MARAGKDTFCAIAKNVLSKNGIIAKQYSFAAALKKEVEPFLRDVCKCDVWTTDTEIKTDMRDFLVWYGTTWWRKRDPKRWIRNVDLELKKDCPAIALVSDVRYPNEAEWVHSHAGVLIHLRKYWVRSGMRPDSFTGREIGVSTWKQYDDAPNQQEKINDPLVKIQSDYKLEWEAKELTPEQAMDDTDFQIEVLKALNSTPFFNGVLTL